MSTLTKQIEPLAHKGDPLSSYQAGEQARQSGRLSRQRRAVLAALKDFPEGRTAAELAAAMPPGQSGWAHRRLAELERFGFARRAGYRRCAVTKQKCVVWRPALPKQTLFNQGTR